jgi:Importin beta-related nuclear transport receptor
MRSQLCFQAVNLHCFPAFLLIPQPQFKLVLDSIIWAFKHTMRNVADTGLMVSQYKSKTYVLSWIPLPVSVCSVIKFNLTRPRLTVIIKLFFSIINKETIMRMIGKPKYDLLYIIRDRKWRYVGHIVRRSRGTLLFNIIDGVIPGRRKRGRINS